MRAAVTARRGDLAAAEMEAAINAANSKLLAGGGVDHAIHRAAGPLLQAELRARYPRGCPTGGAVRTPGFASRARVLIHAVGPRWRGGGEGEAELLASAYRSAFALAEEAGCATVAAPAVSTGAFGFPLPRAARIAVAEARAAVGKGQVREVQFVLFDEQARQIFQDEIDRQAGAAGAP